MFIIDSLKERLYFLKLMSEKIWTNSYANYQVQERFKSNRNINGQCSFKQLYNRYFLTERTRFGNSQNNEYRIAYIIQYLNRYFVFSFNLFLFLQFRNFSLVYHDVHVHSHLYNFKYNNFDVFLVFLHDGSIFECMSFAFFILLHVFYPQFCFFYFCFYFPPPMRANIDKGLLSVMQAS